MASRAEPTELFVKQTGSGTACTQSSPCTLATALSTAASGDTVYVGAGTYTGTGSSVVTLTATVSLLGGWDGAASGAVKCDSVASGSTLDGQNARRVVTITGGSPTVDGFVITRGDATGLTDSCHGASNNPGGCGGGVFVTGAAATISNNTIASNVAMSATASTDETTGYGGGIMCVDAAGITIESNTIRSNTASTVTSGFGGGVGLHGCNNARVAYNRILDNVATSAAGKSSWGGGVAISNIGRTAVVESNFFRDNAASGPGSGSGNGLYSWYGTLSVRDNCILSDHKGDSSVYLGHWGGGCERNRVVAGAESRVLLVVEGSAATQLLANNVLVGGAGTGGVVEAGGPADDAPKPELRHNTIIGSGETTGVLAGNNATVTMTNNILAGHSVGVEVETDGSVSADHTLFWNNDDNGEEGTNAVKDDPMFVNAPRGDYRIQTGSAALAAGVDDGVDDDIEGEPRPGASGYDIGADELTTRAFDFGTSTSPVASGYLGVTPSTTYSAARGYGWSSGTINARDRASGNDVIRDFNFTPLGTFVVDVPNGRYRVAVTMGDRTVAHDQMGVYLEGQLQGTISTAAGEVRTSVYEVSVSDGQLTLLLDDLGGIDPNVVINALQVTKALPQRLDLGTSGSPVASGYARITPASTYKASLGAGWIAGTIDARDRGGTDSLQRDFNFTRTGLFGLFLANGFYDITVTYGDATAAHDQMETAVQGDGMGSLSTAANTFVSRTYCTCVADNLARLSFVDGGGTDRNVVVNGIVAAEPAATLFDFGTTGSPVASGYLRVSEATTYSVYRGYGWLSGTVASRDRGTGSDLARDFNFTADGTFVADVLPGRYKVSIVVGDATTAHDQMGIYLEGTLVDTLSTAANAFETKSYTVDVTDGQLTVRLHDLGGSDRNAVINALEVR